MKKQEIFETVARHLFAQGRQATDEIGICVYRADNGNKCAVGALIPDEMYNPNYENNTLIGLLNGPVFDKTNSEHGIRRQIPVILPTYFSRNQGLLSRLQGVHDHYDPAAKFTTKYLRDRLKDVGRDFNCRISFLDSLEVAQ
jgi:hypothetical protein